MLLFTLEGGIILCGISKSHPVTIEGEKILCVEYQALDLFAAKFVNIFCQSNDLFEIVVTRETRG